MEGLVRQAKASGHYLSSAALICGAVGIALWLLSYVWIPFSLTGHETNVVWGLVVVGEVGAMVTGLGGIVAGLIARRVSEHNSVESKRGRRGAILGAVTCGCVVVLNLIGVLFF
jgi:hypothetical protein